MVRIRFVDGMTVKYAEADRIARWHFGNDAGVDVLSETDSLLAVVPNKSGAVVMLGQEPKAEK